MGNNSPAGLDNTVTVAVTGNIAAGSLVTATTNGCSDGSCATMSTACGSASDDQGGTYAVINTAQYTGSALMVYNCIVYAYNHPATSSTTTITIILTDNGQYRAAHAYVFTGVMSAADPLDQKGINNADSASVTVSTSGSTVVANELIFASTIFIGTVTAGTGYTELFASSGRDEEVDTDGINSTGVQTATWTGGATGHYAINIATFKPPAAAGCTPRPSTLLGVGRCA